MSAAASRVVLEGLWRGYSASQDKVVHREVITAKRAAKLGKLFCVVYTDGTTLELSQRPAKPRERVEERLSYTNLIAEAQAWHERTGGSRFVIGQHDKEAA